MEEQTAAQMDEGQQAPTAETCPNCGMAKEDWRGNSGQGYSVGGILYCCEGCAKGSGCTCASD